MGSVLLEAAVEVEARDGRQPLCYLCYLLFKIFFFPSVTFHVRGRGSTIGLGGGAKKAEEPGNADLLEAAVEVSKRWPPTPLLPLLPSVQNFLFPFCDSCVPLAL